MKKIGDEKDKIILRTVADALRFQYPNYITVFMR